MAINLIQTKPNEYAYLNDINLTVIETNSDALYPPDSIIKEILSKESKLIVLNKKLEKNKKLKKTEKIDIILDHILYIWICGGSALVCFAIASTYSVTFAIACMLIYFSVTKGAKLYHCGTLIKKWKKLKKIKDQIKLDEEQIENHEKEIEELKNEIGYKIVTQMSREEYERRCRLWELEKTNKLHNTKHYFNDNEITLEKYLTIGQKKRR